MSRLGIQRWLGRWYFDPWTFEKAAEGRIYELIGIRFWKRLLKRSGNPQKRWRLETPNGSRHERLVESLQHQARFTREYEIRHIAGGIVMQGGGAIYIAISGEGSLLLLSMFNVLINGYPILLQRYNRVRVISALNRIAKMDGTTSLDSF
jgi:hypothetical protein